MSAATIQQMADRVAGLLEKNLRVGGAGLAVKLRKAGRRLPRQVRLAAEVLVHATQMAQSARLMHQIDDEAVAQAYDMCVRHLTGIHLADRRKQLFVGISASIAFSLLAVAALVLLVIWWRDLL